MPASPPFPLHRLNQVGTRLWLTVPATRPRIVQALLKRYRGGFGLCAATMRLFVVVSPNGAIRELAPPLVQYEMWQLANAPSPTRECPCGDYFDPEVKGPYRERGNNLHHPLCQFDRTAPRVFRVAQGKAANRLGMRFEGGVPVVSPEVRADAATGPVKLPSAQARPDEWEKLRKEELGK